MTAVPTLPTIGTGVLPTSQVNQIRDAVAFLMTPPLVELRQTVAQNINNSSFVAITFDAEDADQPAGQHDNVTNNSRFTATYPGRYEISGGFTFANNATGRRLGRFAVNGNFVNGSLSGVPGNASIIGCAMRTKTLFLSVGDYVELQVFQDSGGVLATFVTNLEYQSTLSARWVSN